MSGLDIFILVMLLIGFVKGWMSGFFRQIVSIVGFIVGIWVACMLYENVAEWIAPQIGTGLSWSKAIAFVLIWLGVPLGLSFMAGLFTKLAEGLCLGFLNNLGGAAIGTLKYAVVLSFLFNVESRIDIMSAETRSLSVLYSPVCNISGWVFDMVCKIPAIISEV